MYEDFNLHNAMKKAGMSGQNMAEISANELCQPKVSYLGAEVLVQQNVLMLDIAVNDAIPAFLMQIN